MPDNVYTETISLDNSQFVSGMQQAMAPLQEVVAALQNLTAQLGQMTSAQNNGVSGLQKETSALRENAAALSDNAKERRQVSAATDEEGSGPTLSMRNRRRMAMMGGILGVEALGAGLRAGGMDSAADIVTGMGGRAAAWGVSGGMMGGMPGAVAGGIAGLSVGALEAFQKHRRGIENDAAEAQKGLAEVGVSEHMGKRALYDTKTSKEMESHLEHLNTMAEEIRSRLAAGLIPDREVAKFHATETSLQNQIKLAETLKDTLTKKEADAEASAMMQKAADAENVQRQKAELDMEKERAKYQDELEKVRKTLGAGMSAAMSAGSNSFTAQGFGTGTAVGAMMGGVESRVDRSNSILQQIHDTLAQRPQAAPGVFA